MRASCRHQASPPAVTRSATCAPANGSLSNSRRTSAASVSPRSRTGTVSMPSSVPDRRRPHTGRPGRQFSRSWTPTTAGAVVDVQDRGGYSADRSSWIAPTTLPPGSTKKMRWPTPTIVVRGMTIRPPAAVTAAAVASTSADRRRCTRSRSSAGPRPVPAASGSPRAGRTGSGSGRSPAARTA